MSRKIVKLKDVATLQRGSRVTKKDLLENGKYPVISGGVGIMGYLNDYNREEDSITIAQYGAAGYVNWVAFQFWANDVCCVLHPNEQVDKKYLYYALKNMQDSIYKLRKEDAIPMSLPLNEFMELEIPLPPLSEQQALVEKLDLLAEYAMDNSKGIQKEIKFRQKQYEYYRDTWLTFGEDIVYSDLGSVAKIQRGASPRPIKNYISENKMDVPWIKIGDTKPNSKYVNETEERITQEGANKSRLLKKGDFILSNSMSFGRPYILNIEGAIHDGWASISEFRKNLNSDFLYHYLTSNIVQNYWESKINTGSVSNLNSEIIKSLQVPLLPLSEQQVIVDKLDLLTSYIMELNANLQAEMELREQQYKYYLEQWINDSSVCLLGESA